MIQRLALGLLLALVLGLPSLAEAQPWSGVLAPSRATDWTVAGVDCTGIPCTGGIPSATWAICNNTACNNIGPGGSTTPTAALINSAIQGAQVGGVACSSSLPCVVRVRSGTWTMTGGISWGAIGSAKSGIVLRGEGPQLPSAGGTKLVFTATGNACQAVKGSVVEFCGGVAWEKASQIVSSNWTNGFNKGDTQITLSGTLPSVGMLIGLDQIDDQAGSDPGAAEVFVFGDQPIDQSSGGTQARGTGTSMRSQEEFKQVIAVAGNVITIRPPLLQMNWNIPAGKAPQAFWYPGSQLNNVGIEDLTIDFTSVSSIAHGTVFAWVRNGWFKNVRSINNNGTGADMMARAHIEVQLSGRITVRDSYFYGNRALDATLGANCGAQCERYGVELTGGHNVLVENNIFQHILSPFLSATTSNAVWGYNFTTDQVWTTSSGPSGQHFPSAQPHDGGVALNLFEGNDGSGTWEDLNHGSGTLNTYFRNLWRGRDSPAKNQWTVPFMFSTHHRFNNAIGNVLGEPGWHAKYSEYAPDNATCNGAGSIFRFTIGGVTQCSASNPGETFTRQTFYRWGNYDVVTGGVRFCGDSSNTNWANNCWASSPGGPGVTEIPAPTGKYQQTKPTSESLPNSFYLPGQPSWWVTPFGTPKFPPIGPGIPGVGNITLGSGPQQALGGLADRIPARLCFESLANDPAYSPAAVKVFNGTLTGTGLTPCYGAAAPGLPAAPTGFGVR